MAIKILIVFISYIAALGLDPSICFARGSHGKSSMSIGILGLLLVMAIGSIIKYYYNKYTVLQNLVSAFLWIVIIWFLYAFLLG